jgi:lambda repressor-like predicted transcriptional regulator
MTIDIAKATELLEHHFATVTPEEFRANLEKFCPELFEQEEGQSNGSKSTSLSRENDFARRTLRERLQSADRQLNLLTHSEIYQKAREDNKIEIAAKLLHKGISVEEVAEILQLDINTLAQPL